MSLARRVAFEFSGGENDTMLGSVVGYDTGSHRRCSDATRIIFVTEAVLLKLLLQSNSLSR